MSNDDTPQGWGVDESSNFLRFFSGTVKDPHFGTNPKIGDGRTLLMQWPVTVDEVHQDGHEDKVGEEENIIFSCGKDWETPDGGETAVHSGGNPDKEFHASSKYGMVIATVVGKTENYGDNSERTDGESLETDFGGVLDVLKERGPATQADVWNDTRWEFAEVKTSFGNDKEGNPMQSIACMPVRFLGLAGQDAPTETPAQKKARLAKEKKAKAAEKAAAQADDSGDADGNDPFDGIDLSDELRATLAGHAAAADDAESFQALCFDDDDVVGAAEVLDVIADDDRLAGVYEALKG